VKTVANITPPHVECTIVPRRRVVGMQIRFSTVQVVGAMLTVLAVLAFSVSPAFGQAEDQGDDGQYSAVCQNLIGAIGDITTGDNTATSNASGENAASAQYAKIAQDSGVSIEQLNECLNGAEGAGGDDAGGGTGGDDVRGAVDDADGVRSASIPEVKALVNTGGIPLAAGAGLLLLASIAVGLMVIGRR